MSILVGLCSKYEEYLLSSFVLQCNHCEQGMCIFSQLCIVNYISILCVLILFMQKHLRCKRKAWSSKVESDLEVNA